MEHALSQTLPGPSNTPVQLARWSVGIVAYSLITWLYDYVFFAFIIWKFGIVHGAIFLTVLTAIVDYICLRVYNGLKQDWLALEYLRSIKYYNGSSLFKRALSFILTRTPQIVQIAALTPYSNAFLTTALLRDGACDYRTMTWRDWRVFWISFLFSQIYWISLVWFGVCSVSELIHRITA